MARCADDLADDLPAIELDLNRAIQSAIRNPGIRSCSYPSRRIASQAVIRDSGRANGGEVGLQVSTATANAYISWNPPADKTVRTRTMLRSSNL